MTTPALRYIALAAFLLGAAGAAISGSTLWAIVLAVVGVVVFATWRPRH